MESINLIQLQHVLNEEQSNNKESLIYTVTNLFAFLQNYLKKNNDEVGNVEGMVSLINLCLSRNVDAILASKNGEETSSSTINITDHLCGLIEEHLNDESKLLMITQMIYQIVNMMGHLKCNPYKLESQILYRLYFVLRKYDNKMLRARIIACMEVALKFCIEFKEFIDHMWKDIKERNQQTSKLLNQTDLDILTEFFDYFIECYNCNTFNQNMIMSTIQNLLISSDNVQRKSAYYLLKKFIQLVINQFNWIGEDTKKYWNIYVNILESLEEVQTHLILPNLMNVKKFYQNETFIPIEYINVLNKRLLQHKNILVTRWSVEHFLSVYTCNDFNEDTLRLLLKATNSNNLFNYENYFLSTDKFNKFLTPNLNVFYKVFGDINWKSVPMYIWLDELLKCTPKQGIRELIPNDYLLKIASRVRALTNYQIRQKVIQLLNSNFKCELYKMSLAQYILYVETLYNTTDVFDPNDILFQKLFTNATERSKLHFSRRLYEIVNNTQTYALETLDFIQFLKKFPKENHEWLRFIAVRVLYQRKDSWSDLKELYNLDLANLSSNNILNEFLKSLVWDNNDKNQVIHARLLALRFDIQECENNAVELEQISLIQYMSHNDLRELIQKVALNNRAIVQEILNKLNNMKNQSCYIELMGALHQSLKNKYPHVYEVFRKRLYTIYPAEFSGPLKLVENETKIYFNGDFLTGDARIEEAFNFIHLGNIPNKTLVTSMWLCNLHDIGDEIYLKYLENSHREITEKKSRYFKNSTEHRAKFKIACATHMILMTIAIGDKTKYLDKILQFLLNETNQLNITLMYEYILGKHENRWQIITYLFKTISSFTPSQQTSVITVAGYMWLNQKTIEMDKLDGILDIWLPLTMGSNYQTRLYSQLFLQRILQKMSVNVNSSTRNQCVYNRSDDYKVFEKLNRTISKALNDKLNEFKTKDIRMQLVDCMESDNLHIVTIINNATDAPYDEYALLSQSTTTKYLQDIRSTLQQKLINSKKSLENNLESMFLKEDETALFIQRKIKVLNDLKMQANLITCDKEKKIEMFVVASLIDKLPNLGGIARTCEVFGIKNLVLDSKVHITQPDFKNLSMTAEKSLNIIEVKSIDLLKFLMEKQTEGFNLIGAEQTTDSHKFNTFKFPEKCILLLGHEKNGIPPSLLNILDNTVEIPQLGNVRSLNVHVTAALFMWEYTKQHRLTDA